jgi:para-nitrobenzyl esterase
MPTQRLISLLKTLAGVGLLVTAASSYGMHPIEGDPRKTSSGDLSGTLLASGVKAYLGIPYAAPPTGQLRWQAPKPYQWDGIWVADRKGAECIQVLRPHTINHYFGEEPSGEDCLTLNMWVPPTAKASDKLPIIVFIYGGGGTIGSAGMAVYGGENVAKHGAIFVNINYRVGVLGFMAHPELSREQSGHSGNYGYLDQTAALQWVKDNIATFGGDPAKVLITGQSFGAGSVAAHLFSPLSKGLFSSAAMWSACNYTTAGPDLATAEAAGLEVQQKLGVSNLQQMRDVQADRILAIQGENQVGVNVVGVRTPPLMDGYFTTGTKADLLAAGAVNDVPIMATSNSDDIDIGQNALTRTTTVEEYRATVRQMYGANADEFLRLYPVNSDAEVRAVAQTAGRENGMLKASRTCAMEQLSHNKSPTYVGLFTHKHPYAEGVTIADQNPATIGAYHTADVPYWFNNFEPFNLFRTTRSWTAADQALSEAMLQSLMAFASTGSPETGQVKWPAWTRDAENYLLLDAGFSVVGFDGARMDWLATHPAAAMPAPPPRPFPRD